MANQLDNCLRLATTSIDIDIEAIVRKVANLLQISINTSHG